MLSSNSRGMAVVQSDGKDQSTLAGVLGSAGSARREITVSNPSSVAQSYESSCPTYSSDHINGTLGNLHAEFGNSGLVSIGFINYNAIVCSESLASVGGDENGIQQGLPIILDGTINTLVVYGVFASGNRFRCVDITNTSPLSDGAFVRAYYDLAHDAIILGSGTTQLSPTCSITIPPGDDVGEMHVQWLKS